MRKAIAIAVCVAAVASFNGCKKETTTDQVKKRGEQQDNYVQKTAKKYTQSVTGDQQAIKEQQRKSTK